MRRTDDATLAKAILILADEIHCEDGIATAAIREAGYRLHELADHRGQMLAALKSAHVYLDEEVAYYDMNTVSLADEIRRAISLAEAT
jgi:hypothetical protein